MENRVKFGIWHVFEAVLKDYIRKMASKIVPRLALGPF
jgi:hypothetical protein